MKRISVLMIAVFSAVFFPSVALAAFLGPYSGTVTDSRTGEPVEGASVLVYSEKYISTPLGGYSEVVRVSLVYTDKRGTYEIPRALADLGLVGRLERTRIVIYQPGYQADFGIILQGERDTTSRVFFKERGNTAKLDRVPPKFDHKAQYQKIKDALSELRPPYLGDPISGQPIGWEKRKELILQSGVVEAQELLRRAEWEDR